MTEPDRPVIRWHGGKWLLAPWIIRHLPQHEVYVEPFGGGGSVLMRKPRAYAEVYNDLDEEIVGLFRVLQDVWLSDRLRELLRITPFARAEFELAYHPTKDPVERARRLLIRSFMGFGSDGHNAEIKTGFRANSKRSGTTPSHDWMNFPDALRGMTERLRGVVIECRPAIKVMQQHDGEDTVHYVDPPYLHEVRSKRSRRGKIPNHTYKHEMTVADHAGLLAALRELQGAVLLSGYHSDIYDDALKGWVRVERDALADGARPRVEVLWMNERCHAGIQDIRGGQGSPLFEAAAR